MIVFVRQPYLKGVATNCKRLFEIDKDGLQALKKDY